MQRNGGVSRHIVVEGIDMVVGDEKVLKLFTQYGEMTDMLRYSDYCLAVLSYSYVPPTPTLMALWSEC